MRRQDISDLDSAELLVRLFANAKNTRRSRWLQHGFNLFGPRRQDISDLDPAELLVRLFNNAKNTRWSRIRWLQHGFNPFGPAENTQQIVDEIRKEEPNFDAELNKMADDPEVIASVRELSLTYTDAQRIVAGNTSFQVKNIYFVCIETIFLKGKNGKKEIDSSLYDMIHQTGLGEIKSSDVIIAEMRAELCARNQTSVTPAQPLQPSMMSKIGGWLWTTPSPESLSVGVDNSQKYHKKCVIQ